MCKWIPYYPLFIYHVVCMNSVQCHKHSYINIWVITFFPEVYFDHGVKIYITLIFIVGYFQDSMFLLHDFFFIKLNFILARSSYIWTWDNILLSNFLREDIIEDLLSNNLYCVEFLIDFPNRASRVIWNHYKDLLI